MVSSVFQESRRKVYENAKNILQADEQYIVNNPVMARKSGKRNLRVSGSKLISIIPISATSSNYVLNVMDTQINLGNSGILPREKRLTLQDVFFTSSIGFFLCALNIGAYTPSHFQFQSMPSPSYEGLFGIGDLSQLMGIWTGGFLEVEVNGETVTPAHWLGDHLNINQTMTNTAHIPVNPYWDQQSPDDGYCVTDPMWIVNGGNNNLYTVKYGSDWNQVLGLSNASTTVQFGIAIIWDGWLAQNASSIMNNQPQK